MRFIKSLKYDANECDLLIIIGTSLKVYPIASLPDWISPATPIIVINKEKITNIDRTNIIQLEDDCDRVIEQLNL